VNYRMLGDDIVFRTSESGSAAAATAQPRVSFSVDHLDDALAEGWSVLASGEAAVITDPAGLAGASWLALSPGLAANATSPSGSPSMRSPAAVSGPSSKPSVPKAPFAAVPACH
jgi:hypothetical protein